MSDALTTDTRELPDLIPARMVNEFTYCPRLFHLEWVSRQWADSDDTAEGDYAHRNVDKPLGRVLDPNDTGTMKARSVPVTSAKLGLTAIIDVLEGVDGHVRPVDTKKGSPPDNEHKSWLPERIQLCVQGLLLRDAGYECSQGQLYFAGTRQRVDVPFTEELITQTLDAINRLRHTATQPTAPLPLLDSPKCARCSLVGICLPDEVNTLAQRRNTPPRRILPKDPDAQPLYVSEQGAFLARDGGRLTVQKDGKQLASLRLIDVSHVAIFGNIQVSTQLLRELFSREIPVLYYSYGGWLTGVSQGLPSKHVELRRRQAARAHAGDLSVATAMITGKIRNSRTLLRRNANPRPESTLIELQTLAGRAAQADNLSSLLGFEGAAARSYFQALPTMLRNTEARKDGAFDFTGRNRRPPKDPVNCLLSFCYALLVKDVFASCIAVGFDPYLGFYHRPRFGRPALALDLAEEFRPIVADSLVIGMINNGEITPSDFFRRGDAVSLTQDGRKTVIAAYERRLSQEVKHPIFGYRITYRRTFEVQTRILAAYLLGDTPAYQAFTTR